MQTPAHPPELPAAPPLPAPPLQPLDYTSLRALLSELEGSLVPSRFEKAQQSDACTVQLGLRGLSGTQWLELSWLAEAPRLLAIPPPPRQGDGSTLAQQLQHGLRGLALVALHQPAWERVVELRFAPRPGEPVERSLVLELMGRHSNLFLLDGERRVVALARQVRDSQSRLRPIGTGDPYQSPPAQLGEPPRLEEPFELWRQRLTLLPLPLGKALLGAYQGTSPALVRQLLEDPDPGAAPLATLPVAELQELHWQRLWRRWRAWLLALEQRRFSLQWGAAGEYRCWSAPPDPQDTAAAPRGGAAEHTSVCGPAAQRLGAVPQPGGSAAGAADRALEPAGLGPGALPSPGDVAAGAPSHAFEPAVLRPGALPPPGGVAAPGGTVPAASQGAAAGGLPVASQVAAADRALTPSEGDAGGGGASEAGCPGSAADPRGSARPPGLPFGIPLPSPQAQAGDLPINRALAAHFGGILVGRRWRQRRQALESRLLAAIERERRQLAQQQERLAEVPAAEGLQRQADGLLCLPDPGRDTIAEAQSLYRRARRLRRSAAAITPRIELHQQRLAGLETSLTFLEQLELERLDPGLAEGELAALEEELQEQLERLRPQLSAGSGARARQRRRQGGQAEPRPLELRSAAGLRLQVGRNHRQNEWISLRQARRGDLWFHAQEQPGSHVVLKGSEAPPQEADLQAAADLAAHFSRGRRNRRVPVLMVAAETLQRIPGAEPGTVRHRGGEVLWGEPERALALLQQAAPQAAAASEPPRADPQGDGPTEPSLAGAP